MNEILRRCLDDLASRIDEDQETRIRGAWEGFLQGEVEHGFFTPPKRKPAATKVDWPTVPINDALHDPELMLLSQFGEVSKILANGDHNILNVRCNYGVSIMTSQLGCEVVEMPADQGNTPTTMALGSEDAIRGAIDKGVPDLRAGQGGDVFDTASLFLEVFEQWPILGRRIALFHPDTQGPIDNTELAWGSEVFMAFYDEPDWVHAFLKLMTDHYIAFLSKWFELVPSTSTFNAHWGMLHEGRIVLRDDSLMNLSPEIYAEFILENEARCLRELGGGMIHFCGRGDHFIQMMSTMKKDGLTAINMSQPHLNDMETIYTHTVDKGLNIIAFNNQWAQKAVDANRELHGLVSISPWM